MFPLIKPLAAALGAMSVLASSWAQATVPAPASAAPPGIGAKEKPVVLAQAGKAAKPASAGAAWNELTPVQHEALKPLRPSWPSLSEAHKKKWIVLSQNYTKMAPSEQVKLHSRMSEWAALSPQQRTQARFSFAETKTLSPDEKKAKWEAYQALSPEERQKLAEGADRKPAGAAPAVKPVAPQKLASTPKAPKTERPNAKALPKIATAPLHPVPVQPGVPGQPAQPSQPQ
ncbi:MAG: DUF3106 domain-containing protein [Burkholderiaceae bacterium]